jgi:hypothetical protein
MNKIPSAEVTKGNFNCVNLFDVVRNGKLKSIYFIYICGGMREEKQLENKPIVNSNGIMHTRFAYNGLLCFESSDWLLISFDFTQTFWF